MKRLLLFVTLFALSIGFSGLAQTNDSVSAEQEEKIKRLSTDIETLIAANAELQKKISRLAEELAHVREDQAKSGNDAALQGLREDLRNLAEKLQEVDKKRVDDKGVVSAELEKIEKLLKAGIASPTPKVKPVKEKETPSVSDKPEKGYEYIVQAGDTLSKIVAACNSQFKEKGLKSITLKQVQDANPGLNPAKMKVGQKIFIPTPGQ